MSGGVFVLGDFVKWGFVMDLFRVYVQNFTNGSTVLMFGIGTVKL